MHLIGGRHLIILSYLAIFRLNVANAADSEIILAGQATAEDVNSLHQITPKEALPFVLFGTTESDKLARPSRLIAAEIKNGRFASGTRFQALSSDSQMFFCPKPDDTQKCLAPKQFGESQVLECEAEPKPILEMSPQIGVPCGAAGTSFRMRFVYKICKAQQPYSYSTQSMTIYSICHDRSTNKVLFAYHMINDAAMLSEKLFIREKQIAFEIDTETYENMINETYYTTLKTEAKSKPQYRLQQLVPSDDMALAWWRKPTQHFTNFALQHKDLIEPWNHIRSLIRTHAIRPFDKPIGIITGAFDIPENKITTPTDKNQQNSIWVLIIIDQTEEYDERLAIVMNNFIAKRSENRDADGGETSGSVKQYIDELCDDEDLSADSLKQVFNKVGGEVRCCRVSKGIMRLIFPEAVLTFQVLHIPNLTKSSS